MTTYDSNPPLNSLYTSVSQYTEISNSPIPRIYELRWFQLEQTKGMARDAETLAAFLKPVYLDWNSPVSEQIFGAQKRQHHTSLEHVLNLLNERSQLHKRHLNDINSSHLHMQGRLFGARLHGRLDGYKLATRLEQTLLQLDDQRRQEELKFWQDSVELRDRLFEAATEYQAVRQRTALMDEIETPGGYHG